MPGSGVNGAGIGRVIPRLSQTAHAGAADPRGIGRSKKPARPCTVRAWAGPELPT